MENEHESRSTTWTSNGSPSVPCSLRPALEKKLPPSRNILHFTWSAIEDETWDLATCPQFFSCLLCAWPCFFFRLYRVHVEITVTLVPQ